MKKLEHKYFVAWNSFWNPKFQKSKFQIRILMRIWSFVFEKFVDFSSLSNDFKDFLISHLSVNNVYDLDLFSHFWVAAKRDQNRFF